jgi:hypothetical protein
MLAALAILSFVWAGIRINELKGSSLSTPERVVSDETRR